MSGFASRNLPWIIGGVVVASAAIVGALFYTSDRGQAPDVVVGSETTPETSEPLAQNTGVQQTSTVAEEEASPNADVTPRLHEVRLEPDGLAVIAGQASPFADVILRANGAEIARASTDASGAFATVALLEPSLEPRILTLAAVDEGGEEVSSPDEMILAPVQPLPEIAPQLQLDAPTADTPQLPNQEQVAGLPLGVPGNESVRAGQAPGLEEGSGLDALPEAGTSPDRPQSDTVAEEDTLTAAANPEQLSQAPGTLVEERSIDAPRAETDSPVARVESVDDSPVSSPPSVASVITEEESIGAVQTSVQAPTVSASQSVVATREASTPSVVPEAAPVTASIAILKSNEDGVEVLRPSAAQPQVMENVALDAISYTSQGQVQLSGRAQVEAEQVRVYIDNRVVAALEIDDTGGWKGDLPQIDTGVYTLRIDEVDAEGAVTSRIETPFKREDPVLLAAANNNPEAAVAAITVQQGATLWAIARERYGEGTHYVRVFEANRDLIRDADLIYPGQVFTLPE